MISEYQVIARKYRPQTFKEVLGQDPIVTTLKNGIRKKRLAHAYLFSGSRGTGKTTLARLFAKALNCAHPDKALEPCNQCSSCKEITAGHSLDVLEIDGASNRGIDDIRQINDTVGYSTASGKYKIYIIDEVHMLTKEAFNALLKTLEEPPPKVIFLFATTEPHKVLPTIVSRCQRFHLSRIPHAHILDKLRRISRELGASVEEEALSLIAHRAEGGLRDAESLLDQILSFHEEGGGQDEGGKETKSVTVACVAEILGIMPQETFFWMDEAAEKGRLGVAFEIVEKIFSGGKDLTHFVEMLTAHFRTILMVKLTEEEKKGEGGKESLIERLHFSERERVGYLETAKRYRKEQCLDLLEYSVKVQQEIRFAPSPRVALEATLLHVMRSFFRIPIEVVVRRLADLEEKFLQGNVREEKAGEGKIQERKTNEEKFQEEKFKDSAFQEKRIQIEKIPEEAPQREKELIKKISIDKEIKEKKIEIKEEERVRTEEQEKKVFERSQEKEKKLTPSHSPTHSLPSSIPISLPSPPLSREKQSRYDTLFQFAAIELEGRLQK